MFKYRVLIALFSAAFITNSYGQAPNINYPATNSFVVGDSITLTPTHTGAAVTGYSIAPALPTELSINNTTGVITGKCKTAFPLTSYTITATATGNRTGTCNISIVVKPSLLPPNISYAVVNPLAVNFKITDLKPVNTGGDATYAAAHLPEGLSIDTITGVISGKPTSATPTTNYTITATNAAGTSNFNLSIATALPKAPVISYVLPASLQVDLSITPLSPANTGGAVASYTSSSLPAGLSIDPNTGIITGMPTSVSPTNSVTVTATNSSGSSSYNFNIVVSPPADYTFWMELGSNFDLLDFKTFKPNNLYAGVLAFVKDVYTMKIPFSDKSAHVSFTGGVYESQSSSTAMTSDSGFVYRDATTYIKTAKGYPYYHDTGHISSTSTVKSIGLFFSPHFLLTSKLTTEEGFHLYFSVYAEMLWQHVNTTFDYSNTKRDTVLYDSNIGSIYQHNFKENSMDLDYRSHYFGGGFPIYIKKDGYSFYLNPVLGITSQKFAFLQGNLSPKAVDLVDYKPSTTDPNPLAGFATPKSSWNYFYIAQFRLTSEQYNVSFTGEVRGFFLRQSQPIISLSISKKFDVGKLVGDLLGK